MRLIGIDPGKNGGIAWRVGDRSYVEKMPETERDIHSLLKDVLSINYGGISLTVKCLIERVHAMPVSGVVQMFNFGYNYGLLRGCLIALDIPFDEVTPQKWQQSLGCLTKGNKNISKMKAQNLYPEKKVIHATADALLILEYLRRRECGQSS